MYKRNHNTNDAKLPQWFPIKVRRTYGWLCPWRDYKSNKWFNTQRHISRLHGRGEPIDMRTGETRAKKKAGASTTNNFSNMQSSSVMLAPNVVIRAKPKEISENKIITTQTHIPTAEFENFRITQDAPIHTTDEGSYSMPFLDEQGRRAMELGYGVRIPSQSFLLPSSPIQIDRFGGTMYPSLGNVRMPGNKDSRFSGPNMHPLVHGFQYYQNNSSGDYVDQLAPHDPAMAHLKTWREIANLFANE
ncbi:MAG: hypothetical protein ACRD8Z_23125 [Nitrososphaeraceae archaeon]